MQRRFLHISGIALIILAFAGSGLQRLLLLAASDLGLSVFLGLCLMVNLSVFSCSYDMGEAVPAAMVFSYGTRTERLCMPANSASIMTIRLTRNSERDLAPWCSR